MGPAELVTVTRGGVTESLHRGHVVVATADGMIMAAHGDPAFPVLARSALKPFQAAATLALLRDAGLALDDVSLAIACASHVGTDDHQIEAARILAEGDLDETALRCPPELPEDLAALRSHPEPTALAHNCSGKHAAMVVAQHRVGADPACYLDLDSPIQVAAREALEAAVGPLDGWVVDGCGAPAWRAPLSGLAAGFARLAAGVGPYARIRDAMRRHPDLVGGRGCDDTALMRHEPALVAKRGAEGVLAVGLVHPRHGALGIAVKVEDGARRAPGPAVAGVLAGLGVTTPGEVRCPAVLGGGLPHGTVEAVPALTRLG